LDDLKNLVEDIRELRRECKQIFLKMDSLNESTIRQDERLKVIEKRQDRYNSLFLITPLSIIIGLILTGFFNEFIQSLFK